MNQKVIAIIPIKGLANVKRRLASRLHRRERARLVLRLLDRELSVLASTASVAQAIVVTADDRVARLAEMRGAFVALHPDNGVNSAIQAGIRQADARDADVIVALHGDLPFVEAEDIDALIDASEPGTLVLAPDRRQQGTNAIVLRRGMAFAPLFGLDSYRRFRAAARSEDLSVEAISTAGLSFDLDLPADLLDYRRRVAERLEIGIQAGRIK